MILHIQKINFMQLLVTTVRRILITFLVLLGGIFGYDYYQAQTDYLKK